MNVLIQSIFGENSWSGLIIQATITTLLLSIVAMIVGAVIGALVASCKLSPRRLFNQIGSGYSIIFRGVPELLIIYLFYFGGSGFVSYFAKMFGHQGFVEIPPFLVGALAIGLISASYQGEVFRAAKAAQPAGQIEAALAIGMNRKLIFLRIIVPQVIRYALPGLANVWQMSLKDSALISVTGVIEIMRASQIISGSTGEYLRYYMVGGACYLILTFITNQLFERMEKRMNHARSKSAAEVAA